MNCSICNTPGVFLHGLCPQCMSSALTDALAERDAARAERAELAERNHECARQLEKFNGEDMRLAFERDQWRACARRLAASLRSALRGEEAVYSQTGHPCSVDDLAEFDRLKFKP